MRWVYAELEWLSYSYVNHACPNQKLIAPIIFNLILFILFHLRVFPDEQVEVAHLEGKNTDKNEESWRKKQDKWWKFEANVTLTQPEQWGYTPECSS